MKLLTCAFFVLNISLCTGQNDPFHSFYRYPSYEYIYTEQHWYLLPYVIRQNQEIANRYMINTLFIESPHSFEEFLFDEKGKLFYTREKSAYQENHYNLLYSDSLLFKITKNDSISIYFFYNDDLTLKSNIEIIANKDTLTKIYYTYDEDSRLTHVLRKQAADSASEWHYHYIADTILVIHEDITDTIILDIQERIVKRKDFLYRYIDDDYIIRLSKNITTVYHYENGILSDYGYYHDNYKDGSIVEFRKNENGLILCKTVRDLLYNEEYREEYEYTYFQENNSKPSLYDLTLDDL